MKEIREQPEVVGHTLAHYLDMAGERVMLPTELPFDFRDLQRVSISACGTSHYAGLVARYWFQVGIERPRASYPTHVSANTSR